VLLACNGPQLEISSCPAAQAPPPGFGAFPDAATFAHNGNGAAGAFPPAEQQPPAAQQQPNGGQPGSAAPAPLAALGSASSGFNPFGLPSPSFASPVPPFSDNRFADVSPMQNVPSAPVPHPMRAPPNPPPQPPGEAAPAQQQQHQFSTW
jgi:hypothetical protein